MKKGLQIQPTEIHWLLECIQTERELVSLMLLLADLGSLGKAAVEVRDRSLQFHSAGQSSSTDSEEH